MGLRLTTVVNISKITKAMRSRAGVFAKIS
jgi:hypothetical protein